MSNSINKYDIEVNPGKTFNRTFFFAGGTVIYREILEILNRTPLTLSIQPHNLAGDVWPLKIESVKCPFEMNTPDIIMGNLLTDEMIQINGVNASRWKDYTGGGYIAFQEQIDLTEWTFRGQIRDKVGGNLLFSWSSDGSVDGIIEKDISKFTLKLSPEQTEAFTFTRAVYDIEAINLLGEVYPIINTSTITIKEDVTEWTL